MKFKLLLGLLCISINFCYAQKTGKALIDSLTERLTKATTDTARINRLNDIALNYSNIDTAKGITYAEQALNLAQKLNYKKGLGQAYNNLAVNTRNNFQKSNSYVFKAIPFNQQSANNFGLEWDYRGLGWLYSNIKDYKKAFSYYHMALKLSTAIKDKAFEANVWGIMGDTYGGSVDTGNMILCYKRDLAIQEELKDRPSIALLQELLGDIYYAKNDDIKTLSYYQPSCKLYQELGNKAGYSLVLWNIASVYLKSDANKAVDVYKQVVKLKMELKDTASAARIYSILGDHFMYGASEPEKGAGYYQQALPLYLAIGDKASYSSVLWNLAAFYYKTDESKGIDMYKEALSIKQQLHDDNSAATINLQIANAYSMQNDRAKTLFYYEQAARLYKQLNSMANYSNALWYIAGFHLQTDENKAIDEYQQALKIKEELHDEVSIANLLQTLGKCYTDQGNYDKAMDVYQQGFKRSASVNNKVAKAGFIASIAGVYLKRDGLNKALAYYLQMLDQTKNSADLTGTENILLAIGNLYSDQSDYPKAIEYLFQGLKIAESLNDQSALAQFMDQISTVYLNQHDINKSLDYANRSLKLFNALHNNSGAAGALLNIGSCYSELKQTDKALSNNEQAEKMFESMGDRVNASAVLGNIGDTYRKVGNYSKAAEYTMRALKLAEAFHFDAAIPVELCTLGEINVAIAKDKIHPIPADTIFPQDRKALLEKAVAYLNSAIKKFHQNGDLKNLQEALETRSEAQQLLGNYAEALADYKEHLRYRDSVYNQDKTQEITRRELQYQYGKQEDSLKYQQVITGDLLKQQTLLATQKEQQLLLLGKQKDIGILNEQKTQAELLAEQNKRKANEQQLTATQKERALAQSTLQLQTVELQSKKAQGYYFIAGLVALLLISIFIWLNYNNQRVSNRLLSTANQQVTLANKELGEKQEEITMQRDQLSDTLNELKAAQRQLIQSEKMASLGELTAGIAHEIQNPLNFVNNFSEVSVELLDELKEEAEKGDIKEVIAIVEDLKQNLGKINHHGKRAEAIVTGMLQHSRVNTGEKQPTDINALADEFLKLSYHGLRAKDKSFTADLVTNFDKHLPKVNVVQQDIGRVLLNLFSNAFYAVNQKKKASGDDYKPTVEVTTFAPSPVGEGWAVSVKDNGNGIPDNIKEKIMQPFFTTKPTGEGTGLGLSLSYEIIVKGHGGKIDINTKEGEGAEFIIQI